MKPYTLIISAIACLWLFPLKTKAGQVVLDVVEATSTVELEICVQAGISTACDTESSTVTGQMVLALDSAAAPSRASIRNFQLDATSDYNFFLDYGLLGNITIDLVDLTVRQADPGPLQPFFGVSGAAYTTTNLAYLNEGTASFLATGLVCTGLGGGAACSGTINLADGGANNIDVATGRIEAVGNELRFFLNFSFSSPIDPNDPALGTINGTVNVNAVAPLPDPPLLAFGSNWNYLDDGNDPGPTWIDPTFDDTLWASGNAELGYGDGNETTTVGFGADPANKFATTWFRTTFNVPDASAVPSLFVHLVRDDGAVVYLNGTEVFRSNMDTGLVTSTTLADSTVGGINEALALVHPVDPGLLVDGPNLVAVEVHQAALDSSDLSFDLELTETVSSLAPAVTLLTPTDGEMIPGPTVGLSVATSDFDGAVVRVEYFEGSTRIAESSSPPFNASWTPPAAGDYSLRARAIDNTGVTMDSAVASVTVFDPPVALIPAGADWRYWDTGSNLGTVWRIPSFVDVSWPTGPAELGYGDGDEATVISFGGDENLKHITTYFRHSFNLANRSAVTNLILRLKRDDGAIVYLNGNEVERSNMPSGTVTYTTLASLSVPDEDFFFETPVNPGLLLNGKNVVAVEVHQVDQTSSDLSFDLELLGFLDTIVPTLRINRLGNLILLRWESAAAGFELFRTTDLSPPVNWTPVTATVQDDGTIKSVALPIETGSHFFQLQLP